MYGTTPVLVIDNNLLSTIPVSYPHLDVYKRQGQYVIPKFRELCKRYNFTILLIHHLNKNNKSLGSTAIDGSVDGIITLKRDQNLKDKILLSYESRDYERCV